MRRSWACVVITLMLGANQMACTGSGEPNGRASASNGLVATAFAGERRGEERGQGPSSPFISGVWKFIPNPIGGMPTVDTEFRFINTTGQTVGLEYAFFEPDGTFCGCDRDSLPPNKTTIYTVLGEAQTASPNPNHPAAIPFQFSCQHTSGALQAFTFKNQGQTIFIDDTTQSGFQTHAFGGIAETPDGAGNFNFITGNVMTEATMASVGISDATRENIRAIHEQCVTVQGQL